MAISVFDLFRIGIGPSSSHTVGPMRAAGMFARGLLESGHVDRLARIQVGLYGSLGATGKGHGTDKALILGLEGELPESVDTDGIPDRLAKVKQAGQLHLLGEKALVFDREHDLVFHKKKVLPFHPNGMIFHAFDSAGNSIHTQTYYSVGGGFVVNEAAAGADRIVEDQTRLAFPFTTATQLLEHCAEQGLSISQIMLQNELAWHTETGLRTGLINIWGVMQDCVARGCRTEGVLPGGLKLKRRAARLHRQLTNETELHKVPLGTMDWVNLYALAVNEENAAGGRVVTAPTNGAAGIIPAVMHYYWKFSPGYSEDGIIRFLLTAAAIGILYKENASISGAEVGCQGEVGSACSMAAAALTEVSGGTPGQVENAA
ncbi:MAG: L-serine ammonia-lyase, partial [Gammaproteobacteria bacterium]|nr:L-serine ammonia-lyase [Gammaproteobacteria bacterium]